MRKFTAEAVDAEAGKDDVREVASGMECGLTVDGYKDVQVGDLVEVYEVTDVRRTID